MAVESTTAECGMHVKDTGAVAHLAAALLHRDDGSNVFLMDRHVVHEIYLDMIRDVHSNAIRSRLLEELRDTHLQLKQWDSAGRCVFEIVAIMTRESKFDEKMKRMLSSMSPTILEKDNQQLSQKKI